MRRSTIFDKYPVAKLNKKLVKSIKMIGNLFIITIFKALHSFLFRITLFWSEEGAVDCISAFYLKKIYIKTTEIF